MTQLAEHHATARFLELPSGRLAVLDAAPTTVPRGAALLVPGFTGSKEDFAPILDPLRDAGYRVIALDLPGQYQSPGPDRSEAYSVDRLGSVVGELAGTVDGEPVHLLGHSFGGLVARAAVLAAPDRYRSLVLLCSGPGALDEGRRARLTRLTRYAPGGMPAVYAALRAEGAGDAALPAEVEEFLRQRFLASSVAGYFGMAEAMLREPDLVDRLRATGMPTLVCFGEQDDAWTPAAQREMAARLAAQVAVIAAAGHSPAVDRPAQTAAALTAFWSTH